MSYKPEPEEMQSCPDCGGWHSTGIGNGICSNCFGDRKLEGEECDSCSGSGICPSCNGTGLVEKYDD